MFLGKDYAIVSIFLSIWLMLTVYLYLKIQLKNCIKFNKVNSEVWHSILFMIKQNLISDVHWCSMTSLESWIQISYLFLLAFVDDYQIVDFSPYPIMCTYIEFHHFSNLLIYCFVLFQVFPCSLLQTSVRQLYGKHSLQQQLILEGVR